MERTTVAGFSFTASRPFVAETLTPLWHTAAYGLLNDTERLRYNQLCGVMVIDQFLRFEHDVLTVVYERPLRDGSAASPALSRAVERLITDEHRHRAVFAQVRQALLPGPSLIRPGPLLRLVERLTTAPLLDLRFWIWFGFAVEESGCHFAERLGLDRSTALGEVDAGMVALHQWHRDEEVHHLAVDEEMISTWFDRRPAWRRTLDATALGYLLDAMRTPAIGGVGVVRHLVHEHPRLRRELPALIAAVRGVRDRPQFQRWFAGPESCPRWHRALSARPELSSVAKRQARWTTQGCA